MASNSIPQNISDLFHLGSECQAGATTLGPSIPLLINTGGVIGSDRANALQLQSSYRTSLSGLPALRTAAALARTNGRAFATKARNWLENSLGPKWTLAWSAVGFDNHSIKIPRTDAGLQALLERMELYFGDNPSQENPDPKVNVTSARAGTFATALKNSTTALNAKEQDAGTKKTGRDTAVKTLQARLRGLVAELRQRIGTEDARWRQFGLNVPSAPTVPAVPRNLAVNTNTPGEFFITCSPSANATHYRFFTEREEDLEPVFAGSSAAPMFHLAGLTPGQAYDVFVTAASASAESRLSKPVAAVVGGAQQAAA